MLHVAEATVIEECLAQMRHVQGQIDRLHDYTMSWVVSEGGFNGLVQPLVPLLAEVGAASGAVAAEFRSRYAGVVDALAAAADDMRTTDADVAAECARLGRCVAELPTPGLG